MIANISYISEISNSIVDTNGELVLSTESKYNEGTFSEFMTWWRKLKRYQFDIETDVTQWWHNKHLISLQFGTAEYGRKPEQWFLQWSSLSSKEQADLIWELNHDNREKLIHNARFEYIVMRFYGVVLENVYDTMLGEKVIQGGLENKEYGLDDISWKYCHVILNKELQDKFGDNIINDAKILYGCTDVMYLEIIKKQQIEQAEAAGLLNVLGLEMDVVQAFSDITYEGMMLDVVKWRENLKLAEPIVQAATDQINSWLEKEPFKAYAHLKEYISDKDRVTINFNSHDQKRDILSKLYPDITGGTIPIIRKYIRDHARVFNATDLDVLHSALNRNHDPLCNVIVERERQWLIEQGYLIPANQVTINWNSWQQVLPLAQLVEPRLKSLDEEEINKTTHPMLRDLQKYRKALKLINQYGEEFIQKYLGPDGLVRCNFNQIISTGRCSTSNPNLQNVVVGDRIANEADPSGLRYRNAFICEKGWTFVDGDYVSQELVIIAYISKDPVWMECIQNGWDLHSVCADLVYKQKWKAAAGNDCAYYKMVVGPNGKLVQAKQKCKCKGHKSLRDAIKPINFGLAYGMTEFKLAGELQISIRDAKALIKEYFTTFPKIGAVLDFMGQYGVTHGWVPTLVPFKRRRYFPKWYSMKSYIEPYLLNVIHVTELGEIERESKNHPIQGTSADIVKVAMTLVRNYIRDNSLWDRVRLKAQVHDQITTIARDDYAQEWKGILNDIMWEAGKLVIPTGILKADVQLSPVWTK